MNLQRRALQGQKKEGNSIEGTGGQERGQTRNCNLPQNSPTFNSILKLDQLYGEERDLAELTLGGLLIEKVVKMIW